ncbi:helicase domain protein [Nitzschia inconspicua]|uniref:Helicase domain protein n=1 Tax=Nitzschia inconspicua TaxID=303405 RepID=A0A9K3KB48_9STRA|nr:helicase domain protein [Nitzschia inconspicua]
MTIRKQDSFLKHSPAVSHANFNMEDGPRNQSEASIAPMIDGSLSTKNHHPMSPHNTSECLYASIRFHKSKESQSEDRFQDLLLYRQEHGHMFVRRCYPPNQALSQWARRQRNEYMKKQMGYHSTLADDHEVQLLAMGFIFDFDFAVS